MLTAECSCVMVVVVSSSHKVVQVPGLSGSDKWKKLNDHVGRSEVGLWEVGLNSLNPCLLKPLLKQWL